MASNVFKVALIGAGGIANAHAGAAKASNGRVQVVAVVDPVEANRTKMATDLGAKAFASPDELFAAAKGLELNGVVVCTPPSVRVPIITKTLEHKLAVLTEKPIAHTVADAQKLVEVSRKHSDVTSAVAYCHRFAPAILEMKKQIAAGKIGKLLRFENAFACDLPGHETKWFSDMAASGGGAFIDMGCHSLDLFHFVVGFGDIKGSVFAHKWPGRAETAATVLIKSNTDGGANVGTGVAGVIISGWAETCRFTLSLFGTSGSFHYDYEKPLELVFKDLNGKAETHAVETHDVRFARQLVAFADAAQGAKNLGLATFNDGLQAAVAVEAANRLAKG